MRALGITLLLALVGCGGMLYAQHRIGVSIENVLCSMDALESVLAAEEELLAKKEYAVFYKDYMHVRSYLTLFIHHNALTDAHVALGRLGVCIADRDWKTARTSLAEAKLILQEMEAQERVQLKNIF